MPDYRYLHYDVFTSTAFEGNPLAVLPDARGLSDATMQVIAREMGFSETTFVLPSEEVGVDARMRIFTPSTELPMAGHPTIGSTFALADAGAISAGSPTWTFGLGVGPTVVDLEWDREHLSFAWMTQPLPQFSAPNEDPDAREEVARALGLNSTDIIDEYPVQTVSSGVPFTFVPVRSREAVDRSRPDIEMMERLRASRGLDHYYVFTIDAGEPDATAYSRMFAPVLGIIEDPATGGACGPLGAYLVRYGIVGAGAARSIRNLQGVRMGRPSRIHIDVESSEETVDRVRVGGQAVRVASGTLHL